MKNSDMKVIAIILSIALFFTIITSNAVSIASVILLAKDGVATEAPAGDQGDQATNQPTNNNAQVNSNNTQTNNVQNNTQTNNTQTNNTQTNNTQNNTQTNNTQNNTNTDANANDPVIADPLAFYQKAVKEITDSGVAGYNKKAWQSIEGDGLNLTAESSLVNALLGALKGTLTNLIKGFMTAEADAEDAVSNKGSDEAKDRMPLSNCSAGACKATAVKDGDNYVVTIVMNDQINPAKDDTDGLRVMSKDILYMEDVVDTIQNDDTVKAVVKELKVGEINYKSYTIKAVMTADGKFVSIDHDCNAELSATIDAIGVGVVMGNGILGFHTRYTNFVY